MSFLTTCRFFFFGVDCPYCNVTYQDQYDLASHIFYVHNIMVVTGNIYDQDDIDEETIELIEEMVNLSNITK